MMQLGKTVKELLVLNLDHWDLFEICFLVLGFFMILIKQGNFVKSANYLFKYGTLCFAG
jgi:hypothetical protein